MTKGLTGILKLLGPNPASWSWSAERFEERQAPRQRSAHLAPTAGTRESSSSPQQTRLGTNTRHPGWPQHGHTAKSAPCHRPSSGTSCAAPGLTATGQGGHLHLDAGTRVPRPGQCLCRCFGGRRGFKRALLHQALVESPPEANLAAQVTLGFIYSPQKRSVTSACFQNQAFSQSRAFQPPPSTPLLAASQNSSLKKSRVGAN